MSNIKKMEVRREERRRLEKGKNIYNQTIFNAEAKKMYQS